MMKLSGIYDTLKPSVLKIFKAGRYGYYWIFDRVEKLLEPYLKSRYWKPVKPLATHLLTLAISILTVYVAVFKVIPTAAVFTYEAVVISTMAKTDTFIFSKTDEVESKPGEHRVYACRQTPCQAQFDSVEYRIEDSLFMDAVYLTRHGIPYDPGELAGAFLGETNVCEVRWYGKRRKFLGFYPKIIGASCQPNEPTRAISE